MNKLRHEDLCLYYEEKYTKEADIIKSDFTKIVDLIYDLWGKRLNEEVVIYVFDSDLKFIFYAYPISRKILIFTLALPYWFLKEKKKWKKYRGVYYFDNKRNCTPKILVKSIKFHKMYEQPEFENINNVNPEVLFKCTLCHELTHIHTSEIELPLWLSEGIATFTEEKFTGHQRDKIEGIQYLKTVELKKIFNKDLEEGKIETYLAIKGYWTVKYLEKECPGFLKKVFENNSGEDVVNKISDKLKISNGSKKEFWEAIDNKVYNYFTNDN